MVRILTNLGFHQEAGTGSSHQTWVAQKHGKFYAVTIFFHGSNLEFKAGTLGSIIRQSGCTKKEFYQALKEKKI